MKTNLYQTEYIEFLTGKIDQKLIDDYNSGNLIFEELVCKVDPLKVTSYKNFVKSKIIDKLISEK